MSFNRPPSQRPPTSGIPHGMRPPSRNQGGSNLVPSSGKGLSVINRPMSKQGLPSANTHTGERQVADKSYFIGVLRNKINGIVTEIKRLNEEIDNRKRGQAIQTSLQQQLEELQAQVNAQEGELSDYNVLSDRIAGGVTLDDMQNLFLDTEQQNATREQEVNRMFKEKRELEREVQKLEEQMNKMAKGEGNPELQQMAQEIEKLEAQAKEIQSHTGNLEGKSKEDLLSMFKELTAKIGDTEKLITDETKSLSYVQNQIKLVNERESDLHTDRGQKYLKLLQREKDMKAYIQSFPDNLEKTKKDIEDAQKRIVDILGQTSRDLESINELPSVENFTKMKSDLQYKERQMADAQSTSIALQGEVEKRRRELADLQNVDKKIEDEINTLKTKMENMEDEMPRFEEVAQVRSEGEMRKKAKVEERDLLKQQLHQLKKSSR